VAQQKDLEAVSVVVKGAAPPHSKTHGALSDR